MKINRTLVSLLTALWLAGCGGGSEGTNSLGGTLSPDQLQTQVLQGRLNVGGQPVANGEVQLRLNGQVLATSTSDEIGGFVFDLRSLTEEFSKPISARRTSVVDVTATIDGARYSSILEDGPEFVWVTELTTLVHDYLEDHPHATFEQANAAVSRSLGCPPGEAVEKLSDKDIFDPATFQQQAAAHGSDQAFLDHVGAGLGTQFYNFSTPDPYKALRLDGQDTHERVEPAPLKVGESDNAYGTMIGVLADNLTSPFGWVVYRLGTNIDPDLGQTTASMTSLQQAFQRLHSELEPSFLGSETYFIRKLDTLPDLFQSYTSELAAAVASRVEPVDTPLSPPPLLVAFLAKEEYGDVHATDYARNFLNTFYPLSPDEKDTIRSYNKLQMEVLGRPAPDPVLSSYDLRCNQITEKLLNNLNFHLGGARIALDMAANSLHSAFLAPRTPGNRLAAEIEFARNNGFRNLTDKFRKAQQLVPPKLDRDDIIALPSNFPGPVPGTPTLLHRGAWTYPYRLNWDLRFSQFAPKWAAFHAAYLQATTGEPWSNDGQWVLPDKNQMQELDKIARAAGGGDALQGLINLGIYPPQATGPVYLLYRTDFGGDETPQVYELSFSDDSNDVEKVATQAAWSLSGPGRAGGPTYVKLHPANSRTLTQYGYDRYHDKIGVDVYGEVPIGALYLRGSISGGTPEQYRSLLATGSEVRPRLDVSFQEGRAVARATYQFATGQECTLDVTDRVSWSSDNPNFIDISNLSGPYFPSGTLIATRPGSANITASMLVDGSKVTSPDGYATGSGQYSSALGAQVRNITITPRNVILASAGTTNFFCTDFSASTLTGRPTHHVRDITSHFAVQWSLRDPNGQLVPANRATLANGVLTLIDPSLPSGTYTVEARLSGGDFVPAGTVFTDQAKVRIQL